MALASRMAKELKRLERQPPPGISAMPVGNSIREVEAQVQGPSDSPFEAGLFKLKISVPDRYPFEPPKVQFVTPVYHPNIDTQGRICLDYLNMPPKGCWGPAMDLYKVLVAIRQLLAEPNPKDPLMVDIAEECEHQPEVFKVKARQHVAQHAAPQTQQPSKTTAASAPAIAAAGTASGAAPAAAELPASNAQDLQQAKSQSHQQREQTRPSQQHGVQEGKGLLSTAGAIVERAADAQAGAPYRV